ncbi:MAG: extracellular solute-binding protein [Bacillota bacterium]
MKKRIFATMMTCVMGMSLLAGCGGSSDSGSSSDASSSSSSSSSDSGSASDSASGSEGAVISMFYSDDPTYVYKEDWPVWDWIEEATGVTFDLTIVPNSDYIAKRELMFTGGNIPDIVTKTFPTGADIASELLLPISDYEDRMPNFQAFIEETGMREEIDSRRAADGKYYSMPAKVHPSRLQDQQWMVRTDIFEKNNIAIPTNMEEMLEAGIQLKELYPNSTPITNRFGSANILTGFAGAYGTIAGWTIGDTMYYDYDADEWIFAPTTDGYKEMLATMNALMENGVLDQEFSTLDSSVYEQRIVNGETFMMYDWAGNTSRYMQQGTAIDPDYMVLPIVPPTGFDDEYALGWKASWSQSMVFPASLAEDEAQLDAVLKFLDWGYTEEAEVLLTFGKEGETYEVNEEGTLVFLDPNMDYAAGYGLMNNSLSIREHEDFLYGSLSADAVAVFDEIAAIGAVVMPNPQVPLSVDQLDDIQIYTSSLVDYVSTMTEKYIFGDESLDNWDAFVAECESKGASKVTAVYAEAMANR